MNLRIRQYDALPRNDRQKVLIPMTLRRHLAGRSGERRPKPLSRNQVVDLDGPLNGQDVQAVVGRVSKPVKARHDQTSPSLQRPPVVSSFRFSRLLLADAQVQDAIALPIYVT